MIRQRINISVLQTNHQPYLGDSVTKTRKLYQQGVPCRVVAANHLAVRAFLVRQNLRRFALVSRVGNHSFLILLLLLLDFVFRVYFLEEEVPSCYQRETSLIPSPSITESQIFNFSKTFIYFDRYATVNRNYSLMTLKIDKNFNQKTYVIKISRTRKH